MPCGADPRAGYLNGMSRRRHVTNMNMLGHFYFYCTALDWHSGVPRAYFPHIIQITLHRGDGGKCRCSLAPAYWHSGTRSDAKEPGRSDSHPSPQEYFLFFYVPLKRLCAFFCCLYTFSLLSGLSFDVLVLLRTVFSILVLAQTPTRYTRPYRAYVLYNDYHVTKRR